MGCLVNLYKLELYVKYLVLHLRVFAGSWNVSLMLHYTNWDPSDSKACWLMLMGVTLMGLLYKVKFYYLTFEFSRTRVKRHDKEIIIIMPT